MKVNLNFEVKDLSGKSIEGTNVGKILAEVMVRSSKGDSIKIMDWALKLYNKQEIEISDGDFDTFKSLVENNEEITVLVKAPILKELSK